MEGLSGHQRSCRSKAPPPPLSFSGAWTDGEKTHSSNCVRRVKRCGGVDGTERSATAAARTCGAGRTGPPHAATPPTRDPNTPGYVEAKELPDGTVPPADAYGNFIIGPTHSGARDDAAATACRTARSTIHDGVEGQQVLSRHRARPGRSARPIPTTRRSSIVTTSHPAPYTRSVAVYVPEQYEPGTMAPFIVSADGPDQLLFTALDNLIAQKRVPAMVAISIGNGSGDAQGSQRGLEYDTMSGKYAEFVETEVLPLVEKKYNVKLDEGSRRPRDHGLQLGRRRRRSRWPGTAPTGTTACSATRARS